MSSTRPSRRGRLPTEERERRRAAILDAALAVLVDEGVAAMTMLTVARRAGASKETLYSWFGDRNGLLRAVIERNADTSAARIHEALDTDDDPRTVLTAYAAGLLRLLTAPASLALNRAAMTDPELAVTLLDGGRRRIGPIVGAYLDRLDDAGVLRIDDGEEAFRLLYGLAVRDVQITVLLGAVPPDDEDIDRAAQLAVDRFFALLAP